MFKDRLKEVGSLNSHQHSALTFILDQSGAITLKTLIKKLIGAARLSKWERMSAVPPN